MGRDSKHLVRSLKLPKIVHHFDSKFLGSNDEFLMTEIPEKVKRGPLDIYFREKTVEEKEKFSAELNISQ